MERVINAVSTGSASTAVTNGLIGASVLIFGGLMVSWTVQLRGLTAPSLTESPNQMSRSIFERLELQVNTCVRGILVVAVYDKAQRLSIDELDKSAAVTLMTTDIAGVQDGLGYLHSTWSSMVELGLGIYALYTFVGYACFLIFIPSSSKFALPS